MEWLWDRLAYIATNTIKKGQGGTVMSWRIRIPLYLFILGLILIPNIGIFDPSYIAFTIIGGIIGVFLLILKTL